MSRAMMMIATTMMATMSPVDMETSFPRLRPKP
jgi:hypothetical protein